MASLNIAVIAFSSNIEAANASSIAGTNSETLTLQMVLELTDMHNPELAASSCGVQMAEAQARQAGTLPNPDIEIEAEDFGGSESHSGYDTAQTTIRLSQTIELSGKRGKRRNTSQSEAKLARCELEAKRLEVLAQAKKAFIDVVVAQEQLALANSSLTLADAVLKAVNNRVAAGTVSSLEEIKAGVEVSSARISRDKARRDLETARRLLVSSWGGTTQQFSVAEGSWLEITPEPVPATLSTNLESSPAVARWTEQRQLSQQSLILAKSARIPDLTVSAGIRQYEEDGTHAGVASLSIPLPLFNRNTGGILAATHEANRAEYGQQAARLRAETEVTEAYNRLLTAREEAIAIKETLLPGAQQAFESTRTGYEAGKFGYLEVLDAQRTLTEAKSRYVNVLSDYHKAAADVEQLTGVTQKQERQP
jgi:cobalt-zinc-cadmium efflux system outer membrane protein